MVESVVKIYVSSTSGNKEVKKRQQKIFLVLDSKNIKYESIDITEPGREADKDFMQANSTEKGSTVSDQNPRHPLPPQIFNGTTYCGDFNAFELANECDTLEKFLGMEVSNGTDSQQPNSTTQTGDSIVADAVANNGNDVEKNEATPASETNGKPTSGEENDTTTIVDTVTKDEGEEEKLATDESESAQNETKLDASED